MYPSHSFSLVAAALLAALSPVAAQDPPPEQQLQVVQQTTASTALPPVSVRVLRDLEEVPEGFWAHASFNDIMLSNAQTSFVFGAVPDAPGDSDSARNGTVIDVFTKPSDPENFQLIQPTVGATLARTTYVTAIDYTTNPVDGSASVTTLGRDITRDGVAVDTYYEMKKAWPGVLATTTITNDSDQEVTLPTLGDIVAWGGMGTFLPSKGWVVGSATVSKAEFVFARLYDSVILVAPKEGVMEIKHDPTTSLLIYKRNVKLKPGESTSYARWILNGQRDPGALFSFIVQGRESKDWGVMVGRVQERVELPDGKVAESAFVPNSEVRITAVKRHDLDRSYILTPYIYTTTDGAGQFQVSLPSGDYVAASADSARDHEPSNLSIPIRAEKISPLDHAVSRASGVVYEIIDKQTGKPIPGKISFVPLRGTNAPELGVPGELAAANVVYTGTGKGEINVPPGNYRVVASCGNEYHMEEQRLRIRSRVTETARFEMSRAFPTDGWISADLGELTDDSSRSRTSAKERVVSAAAEGLDWIVTANPEKATFLQPEIEKQGLSSRLRASAGFRLTSTADRPSGDLTLFPIELCNKGQAEDMKAILGSNSPKEAVERLRALCPEGIILANRPLVPSIGMLAVQGTDLRNPVLPKSDFYADVDAFAVWEGKNQGLTGQAYGIWMQLLFSGYRLTPIGHSLSAGTWNQEPGYPRIYIPSSQSDPRRFDLKELTKGIREGRVIVTNGPFMELTVDGQPIGSTVKAKDGSVTMKLKVYTPNWANVSSVSVNVNGSFARRFIIPTGAVDARAGLAWPTSGKEEDSEFPIRVAGDSVIQVVVEGDPALLQDPVNPHVVNALPSAAPNITQGQVTMAFSGPIYVDANGDGLVQLEFAGPESQDSENVTPF
ncbi:hypothetical protein GC173_06470 [bacterium]|nr:hypothetical protein [bacterium]